MTNNFSSMITTGISRIKNVFNSIRQKLRSKNAVTPLDTIDPVSEEPARGEWKSHIYIAPAFSRTKLVAKLDYFIYTPAPTAERPDTKGMPLVVMLHGCTQNAHDFAAGTRMNQLADQEGFVVLYPQQSIAHNLGKCWRWFDLEDSKGMAEAHSIMNIIHSTLLMHGLDASRVYVAGMSAGAGMASILAAYFPEQIRAAALHSGPVIGKAQGIKSGLDILKKPFNDSDEELISYLRGFAQPKAHQIPALIIHGMEDEVVNSSNTDGLTKQFLYLNHLATDSKTTLHKHLSGTAQEYTLSEYKQDKQPVLEVIKVKHLKHAWSGGNEKYPFNSAHGPMASYLIWDFFNRLS